MSDSIFPRSLHLRREPYFKSGKRLASTAALAALISCIAPLRAWANPAVTTTTLTITSGGNAVTTVPAGSVVTLTATVKVAGVSVNPGQVSFCDATAAFCTDIHLLATAQLTGAGTATFKFIPGVGTHSYKVTFLGTSNYSASTSSVSTLTVDGTGLVPYTSTTTISATGAPGNYTLTAAVTGSGPFLPIGTVSFLDTTNANYVLGTAVLGGSVNNRGLINISNPAVSGSPYDVGVGDFNGDGILDLAVVDDTGNSISVLLGQGDGTFVLKAKYPTDTQPTSIALADFNGDGNLDLAVTNNLGNNLTVLLGNGDGTFTAAASPAAGTYPNSVVAGDFNGDGNADLAVADYNGNTVTVLLGNGDGNFTATPAILVVGGPIAITAADFDGDGKTDLAVGNLLSGTIVVLRGNGDGTFMQLAATSALYGGDGSIAVGDFNGDGKVDLAFPAISSNAVSVLLGKGDGTFTVAPSIPTALITESVAVGDFNGDGMADIAVGVGDTSGSNTATLLLGNGDGTFSVGASAPTGKQPAYAAVGDFNGDGMDDVVTGNAFSADVTVLLSAITSTATATITNISPVGTGIHLVDASFPGDGNYTASISSTVSLTAEPVATTLTLSASPSGGSTFGQQVTLTATLSPDLAQNHNASGTVTFYNGATSVGTGTIASGIATFSTTALPAGADSLQAVYAGDTDFVTSSSTALPYTVTAIIPISPTTTTLAISAGGTVVSSVASGTAITLTATVQSGSTPITPGQVKFCDAAPAHCTDIHLLGTAQLGSAGIATLKFIPGIGSHSYQAAFVGTKSDSPSLSTPAPLAVTGKYPSTTTISATGTQGDYTLTATVAGSGPFLPTGTVSFLDTTNANYVLGTAVLGGGASGLSFVNSSDPPTLPFPQSIAVADFNGDGIADLVVPVYSLGDPSSDISVLLGKGDGTFTAPAATPITGQNAGTVTVGDFNGDGKPDLAVTLPDANVVQVMLGNGDGTFRAGQAIPIAGCYFVATGDFNGDGIADLVVVNPGPGTLTVLLGNGDGTFTPAAQTLTSGLAPTGVAVADFNADGNADLAVVNEASNTLTIFLGHGDGTFSAMAANPATGDEPIFVAVGDFNGDGKPDLAVTNTYVNTLTPGSVTILLGNGDGTFTPAPTLATDFSPYSVAVGDFNADGKADLVVANALNVGTATVLLGNGDGTFTALPNIPAGNDPLYVAVGDFNGDGITDFAMPDNDTNVVMVFLAQLSGSATATVTNISPVGTGTHLVDASYPGDSVYNPSISSTIPLTAERVPTTLTLSANPGSSTIGQPVVLTAVLSPDMAQDHNATGVVTFFSGGVSIGTGTVANGVATVTVTSLLVGTDTLTAQYPGDTNFAPSASGTLQYIVALGIQDFTLTADPPSITIETQHHMTMPLVLTSIGSFSGPVKLSCVAPLPPYVTCELPASPVLLPANSTVTVNFTIDTDELVGFIASTAAKPPPSRNSVLSRIALAALFPLLLTSFTRRRKHLRSLCMLAIFAVCTSFLTACGDSKYPNHTPPGTYTIPVMATGTPTGPSTPIAHTLNVTLTVTP